MINFNRFDNEIVLFGTGNYSDKLSRLLGTNIIAYYVDNDSTKWGKEFHGKPIYSPDRLQKMKGKVQIIIASSFIKEISEQLQTMGFVQGEHYFLLPDVPPAANISYLCQNGWIRSFFTKACVDADNNPLPWITYPAIEFLKRRIKSNMSVLEYGSGYGTLWWSKRVKNIISIEHDEAWYNQCKLQIPDNVVLHYIPLEYDGLYCKKVLEWKNHFDVVVIDGRDRTNCAINSVNALDETGVIIWDNSERERYASGIKQLGDFGFRSISFTGMHPISSLQGETTVFYRPGNCLDI